MESPSPSLGSIIADVQKEWREIGESPAIRFQMLTALKDKVIKAHTKLLRNVREKRQKLREELEGYKREISDLSGSLGDNVTIENLQFDGTIMDQLKSAKDRLVDLKQVKDSRQRECDKLEIQIARVSAELGRISEHAQQSTYVEEYVSSKHIEELKQKLLFLNSEKMSMLNILTMNRQVLHELCNVLDLDFATQVTEVDPSLGGSGGSFKLTMDVCDKLQAKVSKLTERKKKMFSEVKELSHELHDLWIFTDTPEGKRSCRQLYEDFAEVTSFDSVMPPKFLAAKSKSLFLAEIEGLKYLKTRSMKQKVDQRLEEFAGKIPEDDITALNKRFAEWIENTDMKPSQFVAELESKVKFDVQLMKNLAVSLPLDDDVARKYNHLWRMNRGFTSNQKK